MWVIWAHGARSNMSMHGAHITPVTIHGANHTHPFNQVYVGHVLHKNNELWPSGNIGAPKYRNAYRLSYVSR